MKEKPYKIYTFDKSMSESDLVILKQIMGLLTWFKEQTFLTPEQKVYLTEYQNILNNFPKVIYDFEYSLAFELDFKDGDTTFARILNLDLGVSRFKRVWGHPSIVLDIYTLPESMVNTYIKRFGFLRHAGNFPPGFSNPEELETILKDIKHNWNKAGKAQFFLDKIAITTDFGSRKQYEEDTGYTDW